MPWLAVAWMLLLATAAGGVDLYIPSWIGSNSGATPPERGTRQRPAARIPAAVAAQHHAELAASRTRDPSLEGLRPMTVFVNGGREYVLAPNVFRVDNYILSDPWTGEPVSFLYPEPVDPCHGSKYKDPGTAARQFTRGGDGIHHAKYIRRGSVAIDIGAHNGDTTVIYSLVARRTIAFEANRQIYDVLQDLAVLNPHLHITPYNMAIMPQAGEYKFGYISSKVVVNGVPTEFACNGGATSVASNSGAVKVTVKGDTLQSVMNREHPGLINDVSFIKIDAEGYDMHILRSMKPMLAAMAQKPIILIEWFRDFCKSPARSQELFSIIKEVGYYASLADSRALNSIDMPSVDELRDPSRNMVNIEQCKDFADLLLRPV